MRTATNLLAGSMLFIAFFMAWNLLVVVPQYESEFPWFVLFGLICAVFSAIVAAFKGRNRLGWALISLLIGIFGVVWVALLPKKQQEQGSLSKKKQGGISPTRQAPVSKKQFSAGGSNFARSYGEPLAYESSLRHDYDTPFDEGLYDRQEGYDEGFYDGYILGHQEEYDGHVPEGAEWRDPDDDPVSR